MRPVVLLGLFLIWLVAFPLACGFPWRVAHCTGCPGWPCSSNADCDTGGGCACAGTGTGPGVCVGR